MRKHNRSNRGFTLMETIIVVGIVAVLMGLSFIAVMNYRRGLKQLELDETACEVFVAAQNHLTMAKSQGTLDSRQNDAETLGVSHTREDENGTAVTYHYFYYVPNAGGTNNPLRRGTVLYDMLPQFSLDDTVRTGGSYVIEYVLESATVTNVFYSDQSDMSNVQFSDSDYQALFETDGGLTGPDKKGDRLAGLNNDPNKIIGWYGGDDAKSLARLKLYAPRVEVINEECLAVKVSFSTTALNKMTKNSGSDAILQLLITGKTSGKTQIVNKNAAGNGLGETLGTFSVTSQGEVNGKTQRRYKTYILDDITQAGGAGHFAKQWCTGANALIPGEDIEVKAVVMGNTVIANITDTASQTTNSLFATASVAEVVPADGTPQCKVEVVNFRHLENLDETISGFDQKNLQSNATGVIGVTQKNDMTWIDNETNSTAFLNKIYANKMRVKGTESKAEEVKVYNLGGTDYKAGTYAPVNMTDAVSYDGGNHSISNVKVEVQGNAGIFGTLPNNSTVSNLELLNTNATAKGTNNNAGALAGTATGTVTLQNVLVRDTNASVSSLIKGEAGHAGGLVGKLDAASGAVNADGCAAAVFVQATGTANGVSAGGLVGNAKGNVTIQNCSVGGHMTNGSFATNPNVLAQQVAGGILGSGEGTTIKNSYATCSIKDQGTLGGVAGSLTKSTVTNSYAACTVVTDAASSSSETTENQYATKGALVGTVDGATTFDNACTYLQILNGAMPVIGTSSTNSAAAALVPFDKDTTTYEAAYGVIGTDAEPYTTDLGTNYPFKTAAELSESTNTEGKWFAKHYGDWPEVETKVVNTKTSSAGPRAQTLHVGYVPARTSTAKPTPASMRVTLDDVKVAAKTKAAQHVQEFVSSVWSKWLARARAFVSNGVDDGSQKDDGEGKSDAAADETDESKTDETTTGETKTDETTSGEANTDKTTTGEVSADDKSADDEKQDASPTQAPDNPTQDSAAQALEPESQPTARTLETTITSADGHTYTVRVVCDEDANIPEGTELLVTEINQWPADFDDENKRQTYQNRPLATEVFVGEEDMQSRVSRLTETLQLNDGDQITWNKFLNVALMRDGGTIVPANDVTVEVETNALEVTESDSLEAVLMGGGEDSRLSVSNTTGTAASDANKKPDELPSRITFTTSALGDIGLAQVLEEKFSWAMHEHEIKVYGARSIKANPSSMDLDMVIADGKNLVLAFTVAVDPTHAFDTKLWVSASRNADASGYDNIVGYHVTDGEPEQIFTTATAGDFTPIMANDVIALVWDSGYYQTLLKDGSVAAMGEMPAGTSFSAADVSAEFTDPAQLGEGVDASTSTIVAAYDIAMNDGAGAAYVPDAEHPVSVNVADLPSRAGKVSVWYMSDEGTAEVRSQQLDDGSVAFTATNAGTYVIVYTVQTYHKEVQGETWKVSATYTEEAGIPADAEFVVRELTGEEYDAYVNKVAATLGKDPKDVKVAKAFDMLFVKDGEEYHELNESVHITIELTDQNVTDETQVVHMDEQPEVKASTVENDVLSFNSSEFSVYLLLQGNGEGNTQGLTITFININGQDVVDTVNVESGEPIGNRIPAGTPKDNYTFGWYAQGSRDPVTAESTFTENTNLYAKYVYTVTFVAEDATVPDPIERFEDEPVGELSDASKDGYRFVGWFDGEAEEPVKATDVLPGNTTLTAQFVEQVTVTFKDDEDHTLHTKPIDKGTQIGELPDGTKEGCTFVGWFVGDDEVDTTWMFDDNATVVAHYTVDVKFHVKNDDYTQLVEDEHKETIDRGAAIGDKLMAAPVRTGYKFKGWFVEDGDGKPTGEAIKATDTFSSSTNLVAKFVLQVTVTFVTPPKDGSGGTENRQSITTDLGARVDLIDNPSWGDDYRFDGWFEGDARRTNSRGITDGDGNLIDENGDPLPEGEDPVRSIEATGNITLTARFVERITVQFLVVDFDNRSDSTGLPSVNVHNHTVMDKSATGSTVRPFPTEPALSGYKFIAWYRIKQYPGYDTYSAIPPLEAKANKVFVLDNNVNGVPYILDEDTHPDEDNPITEESAFTESTDVVAKFIKELNVTFLYGEEQTPVKGYPGDSFSSCVPEEASKDGFRLQWKNKDGQVVAGEHVMTESDDGQVFTAEYIEQVTLTFKVGESQVGDPITIDKGTSVGQDSWPTDPDNPTTGSSAHFIGWYNAANYKFKADTIIMSNEVLTGQFGYTVTFYTEDQIEDGQPKPEAEPVTTREVQAGSALGWVPSAPYKEGKNFKEWRTGNTVVDANYNVTSNVNVVGYYEDVSIYTVVVNYVIDEAPTAQDPTDRKILTVDKSAVTVDNPVKITSPESFKKESVDYYPVAQEIQIIPDGNTLGLAETHAAVTCDVVGSTITITVPYQKSNATYTVKHMLLRLGGTESQYGTDYVEIEDKTETGHEGVIGAYVTPSANNKVLEYANVSKVASGKIESAEDDVFYVYYTRKNITLYYETGEGSGIISDTLPYGTNIDLTQKVSTRSGYTFNGWYKTAEGAENLVDEQSVGGSITLSGDTTIYAGWKADTVDYTIVYMYEKYNDAGTESSFVYRSSETAQGKVGDTVWADGAPDITCEGCEKDDGQNSESSTTIKADGSSVLYVYYRLKEYTFYFRPGIYYGRNYNYYVTATLNGETKKNNNYFSYTLKVKLGQNIASRWPMSVTGQYSTGGLWSETYTVNFYGWRPEGGNSIYVTKRTIVTNDMLPSSGNSITYSAYWVDYGYTCTVNYHLQNADDDGYTISKEYSQTYLSTGGSLSAKDIAGYTYDHGNSGVEGASTYDFYYNRNRYKIDYYYGSINVQTISDVKFGATITSDTFDWTPTAAECGLDDDYTFDGWYSDSGLTSPYTFSTMPATNLPLYAKWIKPKYTVTFHTNYDDAYDPNNADDICNQQTVELNDRASAVDAPEAPENKRFAYWTTSRDAGEQKPTGFPVTGDTHFFACWEPIRITQYKVLYQDEAGNDVAEPVTRYGNWPLGEKVTETAQYVTGYTNEDLGINEDDTLVYDESTKELTLTANDAENVIVFVYKKKPTSIKYTVKYVLYSDKTTPVADPQIKTIDDGDHISVTETAVSPTVEDYKDYVPTEVTKTLQLGHDENKNVLTFYYTKGAKITVSYLDMEGDPIPNKGTIETYQDVGKAFPLDTSVPGYTFARIEKNGEPTTDTSFTPTSNTETIEIKVYYQYNLSIIARNRDKVYDGTELTDAGPEGRAVTYDTPEQMSAAGVTANGLKSTHSLSAITLEGSQTNVGTSLSKPSNAVISGLKEGVTTDEFYNLMYVDGYLTVTPVNVIISLEPDRWTGNTYNGEVRMTGFTNGTKSVRDYIKINDGDFRTNYLQQIWTALKSCLSADQTVAAKPSGKLLSDPENLIADENLVGLAVIWSQKDVGDYYVPADTFKSALASVISGLINEHKELKDNYNIIQYVRESHLEIRPMALSISTGSDTKSYNGVPLRNSSLTVTVNGSTEPVSPASGTNNYQLTNNEGEGAPQVVLGIETSGEQTKPGTSQNTYKITWGDEKPENFSITEDLGHLTVNKGKIIVEVQDAVKPYKTADPAVAVKVYYTTDDGSEVEIPATLTHWSGNNYTLQLNGVQLSNGERGYIDNLPITITREEGENPGVYEVTPALAADAEQNYEIVPRPGKLTIAIARVKQGDGEWTYHEYLVNEGSGSQQGAFNRAKTLTGNVTIETLCETAHVEGEAQDRYALPVGQSTIGNQNLTVRTTQNSTWNPSGDGHFQSIISRVTDGYGGGSMIKLNSADSSLTVKDLILDGGSENGYVLKGKGGSASDGAISGGVINALKGKSLLLQNVTVRNSYIERTTSSGNANGGGVYGAKDVKSIVVNDVILSKCSVLGSGSKGVSGGGAYFEGTATVNCVTVEDCHADSDKAGGIYFFGANSSLGVTYTYTDDNGKSVTVSKPSTFTNCTARSGGGVYFYDPSGNVIGSDECTVSFMGCTARASSSETGIIGGGGLAFGDINGSSSKSHRISNVTFSACTSSLDGGALVVSKASSEISNVNITDCTAKNSGGGMMLGAKSTLTDVSVNGHAILQAGTASAQYGGAIRISSGTLTLKGAITAQNCTASSGGGGIYANNASVSMGEGTLLIEDCTSNAGGAIYAGGGILTLNGATIIQDCSATNNGGGIYASNVTQTMGGSTLLIARCTGKNGGAIYADGGTLALNGASTILNCTATGNGGGIYDSNAGLSMTGGNQLIKGCTASLGGAIFATGSSANVQIFSGTTTENTATSWGGGALRLEGEANATISGTALISSNKVTGNSGERYGGAVNIKKGKLTVSGGTISNNSVESTGKGKDAYGGAIHVSGFTTDNTKDDSGELIITGGTISSNTVTSLGSVYGGAISIRGKNATATILGGTIDGNSVQTTVANKDALGGAVNVRQGGELTLTAGTFGNNTAIALTNSRAKGAAIHVDDASTLKLSGNPVFNANDIINTVTLTDYSSKTNGGEEVYGNNLVRQDIYIAEARENDPQSMVITGDLTGADASIWVWAESEYHGKQLMPFAKMGDGVVFATGEGNLNPNHLKVFRNARDDEWTENETETYLFGTNEGEKPGYAYWSGISGRRKVILQKVGADNEPLEGAKLTVYRGNTSTSPYTVTITEGDTTTPQTLEDLPSGKSGVFWIGELVYGTYYLHETQAPNDGAYSGNAGKWYCLIVDDAGAFMSKNGYTNEVEADAKDAALVDATAVKQAAS